jgi:manganese transport protein
LIVAILYGEKGTSDLLVFSQVILSLQLSFAVVPLVSFTNDKHKMGRFVNPAWVRVLSWAVAVIIISLNAYLLWDTIT